MPSGWTSRRSHLDTRAARRNPSSRTGADHPHTLRTRHNVANTYRLSGHPSDAVALLAATLADAEQTLGEDHPFIDTIREGLALAADASTAHTRP
ncbi:tetratricopeptide repeat protein [Mycolicibacterium chubuense]|uniref:tetratricopeptide repeat protein n=1 Tax=Mycolicibacterium chubuense TaxID=1800 RepID=UPI0009DA51A6